MFIFKQEKIFYMIVTLIIYITKENFDAMDCTNCKVSIISFEIILEILILHNFESLLRLVNKIL